MTEQELFLKNNFKDEDQRLFFKYNYQNTNGRKKDSKLTEQLYNEEITFPEDTDKTSFLVLLHGSYACNLKCIYCENQHLRSEYVGAMITKDVLKMIVERLGTHIREITWHGGEPLLIPEELLTYLEELKTEYNVDFITTLQTNSVLLTKEKVQFLDNLGIQFGSSFDGLYNDESRGALSTQSVLRCLNEFPDRFGFISVAHKGTVDKLIDNYEYFKSLGVHGVQSAVVRENVIENDNPYLISNDVAVEELIKYLDYWIHDTNNPVRDGYLVRLVRKVLGAPMTCEDMYCLNGWIIIDPFGNITLCGHCAMTEPICNIKDIKNYSDLYYHPKYLSQLHQQKKLLKQCKETCKWYHSCHGGCMGLNYEHKKDYSEVNPRNCEYTLKISEQIYELVKDIDINDTATYNPIFLDVLRRNQYYSLTEIKKIESEMSTNG